MKLPWQYGVNAGDELEALQTDVMRFIAILGLCLVAIFSLVNGAQQDQATEEQPPPQEQMTEEKPPQAPEVKPESSPPASQPITPELSAPQTQVTEAQATRDSPSPDADEPGFALEFESGDALRSSLAAGHIRLFAVVNGDFKRYHPDGVFRQDKAPASYYQMDATTVPPRLRLQAESLYSEPDSWGVILPATAVADIQRLMSAESGGTLLIGADAGVRLAGDENQGQ